MIRSESERAKAKEAENAVRSLPIAIANSLNVLELKTKKTGNFARHFQRC